MHYDWLVVGAGLTGATFAERLASECGRRVLVIDRRNHVAGNAYDSAHDSGVLIHRYGAHIFHTRSERVWDYLSRFTDWRAYRHRVLGAIDGQVVPIPFNLTTLRALAPRAEAALLERKLVDAVGYGGQIPVLRLLEHSDESLQRLGRLVYEKVFASYSAKQWGMRPEDLDRSVTGRVPVVVSEEDGYFRDPHQGIPTAGYTAMVEQMLDNPNINLEIGVDYRTVARKVTFGRMLYTGPLDELFGYRYGPLPYRSLRFEHSLHQMEYLQPSAVVNFPDDRPYTRTLEHKHLTGQKHPWTVVTTEYPQAHCPGETEPYYPVPAGESRERYQAYLELAGYEMPAMILAGRLADYKYYDMDQAVSRALLLFRHKILGLASPTPAVPVPG